MFEYEIYLHIETMICLQKKDFLFCRMFQLFFADKHILSELDIWLLPGLLGKTIMCEKGNYHVGYEKEYSSQDVYFSFYSSTMVMTKLKYFIHFLSVFLQEE